MTDDNSLPLFSQFMQGDFSPIHATELLDSAPEPVFDQLTILAAKMLQVPVVLLSLVDKDRQFFKSHCGLGEPFASLRETPLTHSFCQHVVVMERPLIVNDARTEALVHNNLAIPVLGVIAYLGVPVTDGRGNVLGAFCAIDVKPREWSQDDLDIVTSFAAQVTSEIDLRLRNEEYRQQLAEMQRTQDERQNMARFIIHDLRAPLTSLLLSIEVLPLIGSLNDQQKESLELSRLSGERLQSMLNDLLNIETGKQYQHTTLKRGEYYPQDLILYAVEQVAPLAESKELLLESDAPSSLPAISADGDKLIRVLVNIIGNAVKFTPAGGRVFVAGEVGGMNGVEGIIFTISDTGIGMAPERAAKVFDEGVRLENPTSTEYSFGLGLAFCKRIVEAHGGQILLESVLRKGSTFTLFLPTSV